MLVDAVTDGGPPGSVIRIAPDTLGSGPTPLSSHGLSVADALALARTLYGPRIVADLAIIGIAIDRPAAHGVGLTPAVAAAVGPAADLASREIDVLDPV